MPKSIDEKIEIIREVLIKFINKSELKWEDGEYLKDKLDWTEDIDA